MQGVICKLQNVQTKHHRIFQGLYGYRIRNKIISNLYMQKKKSFQIGFGLVLCLCKVVFHLFHTAFRFRLNFRHVWTLPYRMDQLEIILKHSLRFRKQCKIIPGFIHFCITFTSKCATCNFRTKYLPIYILVKQLLVCHLLLISMLTL